MSGPDDEAKSQAINLNRVMIAGHYLLVLYGHWAVNDPRGSESNDFIDLKFAPLGPIHFGRKPGGEQPTREELREFHHKHEELLNFPVLWINDAMRCEVASAIREVVRERGYTCYACAICSNHAHLIIRKHRDHPNDIWASLAEGIRRRLRYRLPQEISEQHPVISARPYKVYLDSPRRVWETIDYINSNPAKEGLSLQRWDFVVPYNNWPLHKALGPMRAAAFNTEQERSHR